MSELLRVGKAAARVGVTADTMRKWADEGRVPYVRVGERGDRRFRVEDVDALLDNPSAPSVSRPRVEAHYVRTSASGRETSIADQVAALSESATGNVFKVYRDTGSGLNDNRRGLNALFADAAAGKFTVVRVVYADRLTRFGLRYVERLLAAYGVSLEVMDDKRFKSSHEELVEDLLALVASFSGKFYKMRSVENQRRVVSLLEDRVGV